MDNWQNRSQGMKCKSCIWFVPKKDQVGRCRRHAPTMNGYPVVFETDWCGDHKLKEGQHSVHGQVLHGGTAGSSALRTGYYPALYCCRQCGAVTAAPGTVTAPESVVIQHKRNLRKAAPEDRPDLNLCGTCHNTVRMIRISGISCI